MFLDHDIFPILLFVVMFFIFISVLFVKDYRKAKQVKYK